MGYFWWFFTVGIILGFLQAKFGDDIYDFNPDPTDTDQNNRRKNIQKAPKPWRVERFLHRFLGVLVGWILTWVLVDKRTDLFSGNPSLENLGVVDLVLFIFAWIGINGRLPTIAHDVQSWFARR